MPTLVLLRHGKSDWSTGADDRDRPLTSRGRRQAAEAGDWLRDHGPALDLAVVSVAARAGETWSLASAQLAAPPRVEHVEAAYTFDGDSLAQLVAGLPDDVAAAVLVGHNPALEELLESLSGEDRELKTSCLAVLRWDGGWADPHRVELVAHGRPPGAPAAC